MLLSKEILSLFSDKITEHTIPQVREVTPSLDGLPKMHEQFSYLVFRFPLSCLPVVPCPNVVLSLCLFSCPPVVSVSLLLLPVSSQVASQCVFPVFPVLL